MALPTRATVDDVMVVCKYLSGKPTGAAVADARKVLDSKHLDGRKLSALKRWGLIENDEGRFKVTERGRLAVKERGAHLPAALAEVIHAIPAYLSVIERAHNRAEKELSASDVAAHWHQHFREDAGDDEETLGHAAVAFFQIASGVGLGRLWVGRKGAPTRIEFELDAVAEFLGGVIPTTTTEDAAEAKPARPNPEEMRARLPLNQQAALPNPIPATPPKNNRVFITHGKNKAVVDQLKEIVRFGKFEPVVAMEHETTSKPVPEKVMEDMRSCFASIIHVAGEDELLDAKGTPRRVLNENVLIEIGASMALYGRNFVLLVEDGVQLPSNLQGLYQCRYTGSTLDGSATMKLLKIFNEMK